MYFRSRYERTHCSIVLLLPGLVFYGNCNEMPRPDRALNGFRVFIGGVDPGVGKVDLEREFDRFGPIADVWVARNPPGFAFIVFKYSEDAERAVRRMDGR